MVRVPLCVRVSRVCVNLKQDHTVQRRSCRRVPGGARLHDYWQQASKRGAAKEVRFPGFRPDGDGERRADHGGERDEAQVVREEGGGGRARRAVDRAVGAPFGARLGVPRVGLGLGTGGILLVAGRLANVGGSHV